jgi:hypothetical protein
VEDVPGFSCLEDNITRGRKIMVSKKGLGIDFILKVYSKL